MKRKKRLICKDKKSGRKIYLVTEYRKSKPRKIKLLDNLFLLLQTAGLIVIGFGLIYPILFFGFENRNQYQTFIIIFSFISGIILIAISIIALKRKKAIPWAGAP